jgi:hypothetical protein
MEILFILYIISRVCVRVMKLISLNLFQYMASEHLERTFSHFYAHPLHTEWWWWEVKFITLTRNVVVLREYIK